MDGNRKYNFPFLEHFHAIEFVTPSHIHQQELFLSVVRIKTMPKKETFDFGLMSMAHKHLDLNSLLSAHPPPPPPLSHLRSSNQNSDVLTATPYVGL